VILSVAAQWFAFGLFSLLAVLGGLGMATTMSMFRSGIFLMASFIGVAGLFILLSADLLGLLQVMMYIGGMLVMVMFMVLFMMDPGGSMMAGMKMSFVERFFSRGLAPEEDQEKTGEAHDDAHTGHPGMHEAHSESADTASGAAEAGHNMQVHDMKGMGQHDMGMPTDHAAQSVSPAGANDMDTDGAHAMQGMAGKEMPGADGPNQDSSDQDMKGTEMQQTPDSSGHDTVMAGQDTSGHDMDMGGMDMSMTTPARPWGIWLGVVIALGLGLLILFRPAWPTGLAGPLDPDSPRQIGNLLMSKYMIGFEGAGLLILLGIMGAVFIQRPGSHPSDPSRAAYVTADEQPATMLEPGPLPGETTDGRSA
jgi:NADH-quinone oxidoreductase subunit J